jgi:hypothetical protein
MTCDEFERVLPELEGGHSLEQEAHLRSCTACSDLLADLNAIGAQARQLPRQEPSPALWNSIAVQLRREGLIREDRIPSIAHNVEDEVHVAACVPCAAVATDLNAIQQQARLLQASEEPPARVWKSIALELEREGIVREPQVEVRSVKSMKPYWRLAWLAPTAVAAMVILGTVMFERGSGREPQVGNNIETASVADSPTQAEERELLRVVSERAPALKSAYEADLKSVDSYIDDAEKSAKANPQDEVAQQYLMNAYEQRAMIYEMAMKH